MNQPTHQNHVEKTTQNANMLPDRPVNDLRLTSMDDFNIIDQVGEGTYGRVFKACHKKSGKLCALKMVFPIEEEDGLSFTAIREIKYLQQLANNPNVITLLGTFFTAAGELVLCFEYMENDLSGLLSLKDVEFSPAQIKCLMKQILDGLHQCHVAGIMHRDIKAANLLVTDGVLKLADFGLATNYTRRPVFSTNVVTLWYRAPELLLGITKYKAKVDIWSAGCIFIELLTRQSPFPGRDERHQMELICKTCGSPTEENWPGVTQLEGYKLLQGMPQYRNRLREIFSKIDPYALDLICKMLTLDPESRITASQALDHDFFWTNPMPCQPSELPAYPSMHEYEAKRTRQTEQKQAKRQKGESYRAPAEQPSAYPGVRRPQIRVPGWQPPAPNQRPPVKPALNGNMPGSAIVDRNAGQQYPSSVQPYPQQQQQNRHWEREGSRSSGGHVNGDSGRIGEKGTAVQNGTSRTNNGRRSGVMPPADVPRRGGYPQHPVDSWRGGGSSNMDIDKRRGGSEMGITGVRLEKTKERMDTEVEEGEILMLNRPPSDHSLDSQLQPPTGLSSFDHLAEFDGGGLGGGSPSAFATNRVMVSTAAGKRKREEIV